MVTPAESARIRTARSDAGERTLVDDFPLDGSGEAMSSGLDLRYLISAVRANSWLIAAIIVIALAISLVSTLLETPRYTAVAKVQINSQADRVLGDTEAVTQEAEGGYDTDRFLQTQVDVLTSRGIADRVARRLKLFGNQAFLEGMEAGPMAPGTPANIVREATIGLLQGNVSVDLPRNSRVISISFESADPALAAKIANAFADEFIAANLQRKFDSSAYARNFIADQLAEAKTRLEASEIAVNSYAREAGLIRTRDAIGADEKNTGGGSVTTASLIQLNTEANAARASRIAAEGRWRAMQANKSLLSSPEVFTNTSVQAMLTKRAEVRTRLNQERVKHLEDHPTVIQLRAEADEVERQLNTLLEGVRQGVKAQYDAALNTERELEQQVANLKNDTLAEQQRSVQFGLLSREADTNRTIYDGLLQRYKELNAAAGISASNISVIDQADPPLGPSSPNLFRNLAVAFILGVGVAGVVVLFRSQFDDSIRVPEDVEHKLRLPLLGVIPKSDDEPSEALSDPKSPVSEAYNSLGGSLLYSTSEGLPHVMLVTSAQPSEGKSITSFAIASGFARIGKRVVLIDMDLRRPSVHRRIGADNSRGMSTLLTSHDPIESVVIESGQEGLQLITSGPVPPSPTELIASNRMQALIDELADRFDVVIVDSPPILGLADAPLMSALVDGVMVVVEADRNRRGTLKSSLRRLRTMRPVLLGVVLSKFDPKKVANRYSDYYGYDYYQYRNDDTGTRKAG